MADVMQAFRMLEWQAPPQLCEMAIPQPGPGQLLVKVAGNGLCHSDLHMMHMPAEFGPSLGWQMPFTLGHEIGGWIESCGKGVRDFEPGQAVALVSPHSCGKCRHCLSGHDNVCIENGAGRGYGKDGGLAEYVLVEDRHAVLPLSNIDPATAGPFTDAGATSYHGFRRVREKLDTGAVALIIGAGGLGSFAIQYVKTLTQAELIVADISAEKLAAAHSLGADVCIDTSEKDLLQEVMQLTDGWGVNAVLDFVGSDATIASGVACLGRLGSFGLVGAENGGHAKSLFSALASKEADIFSFMGPTREDTRAVLELAGAGELVNPVERFSLAEVETAYKKLADGTLKGRAVIIP